MYPEEFLSRMQMLLKEEYPDFLESLEQESCKALRLNPLKAAPEPFLKQAPFSLEKVPWAEYGYYYKTTDSPGRHPFHEAGVYYIQEPSAMAPVSFLAAEPGERILDLCAAPGGKSTQIGGCLKGEGLLVSNEIHPARAKILSSNMERLGISNSLVLNETPERLSVRFPEFFDKILVDAPCSGEGMFRKNREAVSQWSLENVKLCAKRQDDVLKEAAKMLRPGGRLVYSTCTFALEENEDTISRFLATHPDFRLKSSHRLFPHKVKGEGHFMAILYKSSTDTVWMALEPTKRQMPQDGSLPEKADHPKKTVKASKNPKTEKLPREVSAFFEETLSKEGLASFSDLLKNRKLLPFGEQLYLLPEGISDLKGLKVLRPGLHLGALRKNRFEPSHGLALFLKPAMVKRSFSFPQDSPEIRNFLAGQTLPAASNEKGWSLICVEDYSLGWGKLSGGTLKNHYPKGLRTPT